MQPRVRPQLAALVLAMVALIAVSCAASETVITETTRASNPSTQQPAATAEQPADPDETASIVTPSTVAEAPAAAPARSADRCRYVEVDDYGDIQIEIDLVATEVQAQDDTFVHYVVFSEAGAEITASSQLVEDLMPGERIRLAVDTVEDAPPNRAEHDGITCEIVELVPFAFGPEPFRPVAGDSCRVVQVDTYGDIQVEIEVANPLSEHADLAVDYALRGPDGTRFGDAFAHTAVLAPGERLPKNFDSWTEVPEWLSEAEVSCEILAIENY